MALHATTEFRNSLDKVLINRAQEFDFEFYQLGFGAYVGEKLNEEGFSLLIQIFVLKWDCAIRVISDLQL